MNVHERDLDIEEYNGIRIGDMITAYHKGYHRVIGFREIDYQNSVQIVYVRVADSNGEPLSSKPKYCHHQYCQKVDIRRITEERDFEIYCANIKYSTLYKMIQAFESEKNFGAIAKCNYDQPS